MNIEKTHETFKVQYKNPAVQHILIYQTCTTIHRGFYNYVQVRFTALIIKTIEMCKLSYISCHKSIPIIKVSGADPGGDLGARVRI